MLQLKQLAAAGLSLLLIRMVDFQERNPQLVSARAHTCTYCDAHLAAL